MGLESKILNQETEIAILRNGIQDLQTYLESPKFFEDTTVQAKDIDNRLQEIINNANLCR